MGVAQRARTDQPSGTGGAAMIDRFNRSAAAVTMGLGSPAALVLSVALVVGWAVSGPFFGFSTDWQLFINTTTTVVTYLMVFVIQNAANRESKALQLKLDEIIRAIEPARNEMIHIEKATDAILGEKDRDLAAQAEGARE